jgi:hypothetical protein
MNYPVMAVAFFAISSAAFGQHLVVTAEGRHGAEPPEIAKDAVSVEVNKRPARVDKWIPLRGDQASLELYIVIDDGEDTDLGVQFESLKRFVNEQPSSTQIGLAYLRYGSASIVTPLTTDRGAFARSLRLPLGQPGISASPYMGISDLVKKWPAADARREVLLISSGIDPWSPPDPRNPYLQSAIAVAQRAGVLVHSIYYSGAGHPGKGYGRIDWGQNYLSELGDETGGEAYWQGFGSSVLFDSFLKDLSQRLRNQYLLTIALDDAKGGLEPIRVSVTKSDGTLMPASNIYIPKQPD